MSFGYFLCTILKLRLFQVELFVQQLYPLRGRHLYKNYFEEDNNLYRLKGIPLKICFSGYQRLNKSEIFSTVKAVIKLLLLQSSKF